MFKEKNTVNNANIKFKGSMTKRPLQKQTQNSTNTRTARHSLYYSKHLYVRYERVTKHAMLYTIIIEPKNI